MFLEEEENGKERCKNDEKKDAIPPLGKQGRDACLEYVPAVVITSLTVMGMGGRKGMAMVVVAEEVDVEIETSGLVRQKMLETKACIIFGWCGRGRRRSVRLLRGGWGSGLGELPVCSVWVHGV